MCGFFGKFNSNNIPSVEESEKMFNSLKHRGPDSKGWCQRGSILLGFTRLSIIDTAFGNQPFFSETQDVVGVVNGEIYNFGELKTELKTKGHQFRTGSDCEVVVHLYEEYGPQFVCKLNGMFAFCLYDSKREKILLGRDRLGIKPLYYARKEGGLFFASEIKAILQASEITLVENAETLEEYLCFRALSGSRTFFADIELLPPGALLEASPVGTRLIPYWKPEYRWTPRSRPEAVQTIHETLRGSVSSQLMADVPLGTQLSGGIDSSWVSCLAGQKAPGMKSFSVGFAETAFDETTEAKAAAKMSGLEYHQITSDPTAFAEILPTVIWHNDEPLTHANSVEIYNLCRYAREHVKVLLTGEGADELFAGYPRYFLPRMGEAHARVPAPFRPVLSYGLDFITRGRGKKPSSFLGMSSRDHVFWNAAFTQPDKVAWLMDKECLNLDCRRQQLEQSWRDEISTLDNLLLYELRSYLQPILLRQDKMSMGASIESRVPILDNEMIDLALSFTAAEKMRNFCPKSLFKEAATKDLPGQIVKKRKVGFSVPVGIWMRKGGTLGAYLDQVYDQRMSLPGINPRKLEQLIGEHREGHIDHQDILWPLLNYVVWKDVFFSGKKAGG